MLTKEWQNVLIQKPSAIRGSGDSIPLSRLYDSGFFVTEIFGSEAWVVNQEDFYSQVLRIKSNLPKQVCKGMKNYAEKQYKRFLIKQKRLQQRLLEHRQQIQF